MPKLDKCHPKVVQALQKDGWTVNPKPKRRTTPNSDMIIHIDLEAWKANTQRIFVEVKCFPKKNKTQELHIALGQYILYRGFLAEQGETTPLYLAVPEPVYADQFNAIIRQTILDNAIKVVVIDLAQEVIVQWIG
jgi:hypothetical protein